MCKDILKIILLTRLNPKFFYLITQLGLIYKDITQNLNGNKDIMHGSETEKPFVIAYCWRLRRSVLLLTLGDNI